MLYFPRHNAVEEVQQAIRNPHSVLALGLIALALLAGCESASSPAPTPTPIPVPTQPPTPTLPQPSPTASRVPPTTTPAATPAAPSGAGQILAWAPTIPWRGSEWYLLGTNYPYLHYGNDFGGNLWGNYGVHDPTTYKEVDADFARMSELGLRTVRWFAFADGRAGITYDSAGLPTGLDLTSSLISTPRWRSRNATT